MRFQTFKTILFFLFFLAQFQAYSQCEVDVYLYIDETPTNGEWEEGTETLAGTSEILRVFLVQVSADYTDGDATVVTTPVSLVTMTLSEGRYQATIPAGDCDKKFVVLVEDANPPVFTLANSGTADYMVATGDNDNDFIDRKPILLDTGGGTPVTFPGDFSVSGLITFPNDQGANMINVYGGGNPDGLLPVELLSFSGVSTKDCSVKLEWATATESENAGFFIETSTDGRDFEGIGWVEGAGNSSEETRYGFVGKTVSETNYYRLKQVDYDGAYEYSNSISVRAGKCGNETNEITLFPSPAKNFFSIESTLGFVGKTRVTVMDCSGGIHLSRMIDNGDTRSGEKIDVSDLAEGLYFVRIIDESNQVYPTQKIMKH